MAFSLGDLINTGANVVGGVVQHRAAGKASQRGVEGTQRARDIALSNAERMRSMYKPWMAAGQTNLDTIQSGLQDEGGEFNSPFTGANLSSDPGYQFGLQEGQKAIDAARRAMGTRFSGGAVKESIQYGNDYAGTKFNEAFQRNRQTQNDRFDRLKSITDLGYDATTNAADAEMMTSQQLQDLEVQKADAEAAGDLGKAGAIQGVIENGMKAYDAYKTVAGVAKTAGAVAGLGGTATAATGVGTTAAGVASGSGATASVIGSTTAAASTTGATSTAAATSAASGGSLGSTMAALATNPITIGVAAAIAVGAIWLKSQAHWEANTAVKNFENPFHEKVLAPFAAKWDEAVKGGKLNAKQGNDLLDEYVKNFTGYGEKIQEWGQKGDKNKVALQSMANLYKTTVGPQIDRMKREIAAMPGAAEATPTASSQYQYTPPAAKPNMFGNPAQRQAYLDAHGTTRPGGPSSRLGSVIGKFGIGAAKKRKLSSAEQMRQAANASNQYSSWEKGMGA